MVNGTPGKSGRHKFGLMFLIEIVAEVVNLMLGF